MGLGGHVQQQPQPSRPSAQELMTLRLRKVTIDVFSFLFSASKRRTCEEGTIRNDIFEF